MAAELRRPDGRWHRIGPVQVRESGRLVRTLRELAQREPYLVKGAAGADYGGGARGEAPPAQPSMNELLRSALGKG